MLFSGRGLQFLEVVPCKRMNMYQLIFSSNVSHSAKEPPAKKRKLANKG